MKGRALLTRWRVLAALRSRSLLALNRLVFGVCTGVRTERIGSDYGGWIVPCGLVDSESVCYLFGVGEDASLELGLLERFGCAVYSFDPTPRAISYVERLGVEDERFHFRAVGIWSADAMMRWYAPRDASHVSHSIVNIQETSVYFTAQCMSLESLMAMEGHSTVDVLKLDIEGAEHEVLASILHSKVRPAVIAVEFDQPWPWRQVLRTVKTVRESGYRLVAMDRWNFTFASADSLANVSD